MRVLAIVAALLCLSGSAVADTYVRGYFRSDGTYVQPHFRTNPDGNVWNNWSTQGNINPYTGQTGTVDPYSSGSYGANNLNRYMNPYGYSNPYGYNRRW